MSSSPRLQDYVLATVYEGIDEAATEAGVATFVTNFLDDSRKQALATESLLARRVDGLIYGDAHFDGEFLASVAERGIPFVLVSRSARGFPSVPLTTVVSPMREMGHQGFTLLTEVIRGAKTESVQPTPTLVTRASTA